MPAALDFAECRRKAKYRLPRGLFQYIDRGTEAELALATIRQHLDAVRLVPVSLAGPAPRDVSTVLMGMALATPVIVAPTALAGLVVHDGEAKLARAAARLGMPFCVSTQSITPIEDIRAAAPDAHLWFQLYMFRNRELTWRLLDRVRDAGVDTLVVTSDTPAAPIRRYNQKNGFGVPVRASLPLALDLATHPRWTLSVMLRYVLGGGIPTYGHYPPDFRSSLTRDAVAEDVRLDQNLDWDDIDELRRR
ncbi:isopentenyl diphosphate isomerase/L-lactate dehydrogenase-like FMN-dependent dehydrogenase [Rhodobium orientis]|nr:isopentenyl diphosphate isomerase/L-lactate dehydrogenase-like FMN-dependent dehydrogenase [Rhodobium orientis]